MGEDANINEIKDDEVEKVDEKDTKADSVELETGSVQEDPDNLFMKATGLILKTAVKGAKTPLKEMGVDNIKEIATVLGQIAIGIKQAKADNKWNIMDGLYFIPALQGLYGAVDGSDLIDDEVKDLDKDEVEEIRAHVYGQIDQLTELTDEVAEWIDDVIRTSVMLAYCVSKGFRIL